MATAPSYSEIWEANQRATVDFKLCPNRIWALATSLPEREKDFPLIIPSKDLKEQIQGHDGHDQCGFDFCLHSHRDFTAVGQRHESETCNENPCGLLYDRFPGDKLIEAALDGKPTAWTLDGKSLIEPPQPYMAISHVWADGTGAGAWQHGEVNKCLFNFFKAIAEQFRCEGIWWDTVCIPKEKAARNIAINKMQGNYEDARITLVHDCFLRQWKWIDAQTVCFAIILSPWFSRGWTALELAKSHKVKVLFKGAGGPVIKDLDEDILVKAGDPAPDRRHRILSDLITSLRHGEVRTVNELLAILGSRYTSWPRDIATISGLLAGIKMESHQTQQNIYQDILKKMAKISRSHLFHNSATMSRGLSWCPTNLLNLQLTPSKPDLCVYENGDVVGKWRVIDDPDRIPEASYNWKPVHPLIKARVRSALRQPNKYWLLAEPLADSQEQPWVGPITRALLVEKKTAKVQFISPVYFDPPLEMQNIDLKGECQELTIGGEFESSATTSPAEDVGADVQLLVASAAGDEKRVGKLLHSGANPAIRDDRTWTALHNASWRCHFPVVQKLLEMSDRHLWNLTDRLGQQPIHLASERGNEEIVGALLEQGADPNSQCMDKQTALHRASWAGSREVVKLLLPMTNVEMQDSRGHTALQLALMNGHREIAVLLLEKGSDINTQDSRGWTPFHFAASSGDTAAAQFLLDRGAKPENADSDGWRPLHLAAEGKHSTIVHLLLNTGADVGTPSWRLLHSAAKGGAVSVMCRPLSAIVDIKIADAQALADTERGMELELLPEMAAELESKDKYGRTPLSLAAAAGREVVVDLLLEEGAEPDSEDKNGRTPLSWASEAGHRAVVMLLLDEGVIKDSKDRDDRTPLSWAAAAGQEVIVHLLLEEGAERDSEDKNGRTPLSWASEAGHRAVVMLLLDEGVIKDSKDRDDRTPLSWAAATGQKAVVQLLLEKGANLIQTKDSHSRTPLSRAAENGHEGVVRLLLDKRAVENEDNQSSPYGTDGPRALAWATENGHVTTVRLLLSRGLTLHPYEPPYFWTPITEAVKKGHEAVAKLLLGKYRSPLIRAAQYGCEEIVRFLFERGEDLHYKEPRTGRNPLSYAAEGGHETIVRLLLENGANPELKDDLEKTPLLYAALGGKEAVVRLLLEKDVDTEPRDKYSVTPLWWAVRFEREGTVRLLLEKGAKMECEDWGDNALLRHAAERGYDGIVRLLLEKGAKMEYDGLDEQTLLWRAVKNGHEGIVGLLLERGAKMEFEGLDEQNLLSRAAENGHEGIARLLLKKGAKMEFEGLDGQNLLWRAVENGHEGIARLLLEKGAKMEFKGSGGQNLLWDAVKNGHDGIARLLLEKGADLEGGNETRHINADAGEAMLLQEMVSRIGITTPYAT